MVLNSNHLHKKTVVDLGATTYFTSVWTGEKKGGWIQWSHRCLDSGKCDRKFHTTACNSRSIFWKSSR